MGYAKTFTLGKKLFASDTPRSFDANEISILWDTYTLTKAYTVIEDIYPVSTIKITFDIRATGGGDTTYGKIYHNGVAKTAAGTTISAVYETKTISLCSFTNLKIGDTIELWTYNTVSNGHVTAFIIYYDESVIYMSTGG